MSLSLSINDFKRLGAASIEQQLEHEHEIVITSHGKNKYVIIQYNELLQMQEDRLELAYLKTQEQIKNGESWIESIDDHVKRLNKELSDE